MNNNPCIIFDVEGSRLLMYIRRVSDNACSPPNKYPYDPRHLSEFVCDSRRHSQVHPKFSPALRRAPKLITITPIVLLYQSSEIPVTPVAVVRDPSYSEGRQECPPRVWYSPEIDASKFTLHIHSDTSGGFQLLKYILLMHVGLQISHNRILHYCLLHM